MTELELDAARANTFASAVASAHVLVTTGSGGVGKTTTAAAIGLAAARAGRRTLVLTIDPAKRLAQSMGLDELSGKPGRVALDAPGELWAMMLDMRSTFDDLIDRHASSPDSARAIKGNRIYQALSTTLSGTQEYMAMEKLYELHESGEWDLIVIDTPPSRSALDFLDAPKRMTGFLDGNLLSLFLKPGLAAGKGYMKVVGFGATAFMKVAGKVTGMALLEDLAEFFRNFEGMYDGFKERAAEVLRLLSETTSQFIVVTTPQPPPLREAQFFLERLEQEGLHAAGVVVNRINPTFAGMPQDRTIDKTVASLHEAGDPDSVAVASALQLATRTRQLAERERREVQRGLRSSKVSVLVDVPLLSADVHDLVTLGDIADALTGSSAP